MTSTVPTYTGSVPIPPSIALLNTEEVELDEFAHATVKPVSVNASDLNGKINDVDDTLLTVELCTELLDSFEDKISQGSILICALAGSIRRARCAHIFLKQHNNHRSSYAGNGYIHHLEGLYTRVVQYVAYLQKCLAHIRHDILPHTERYSRNALKNLNAALSRKIPEISNIPDSEPEVVKRVRRPVGRPRNYNSSGEQSIGEIQQEDSDHNYDASDDDYGKNKNSSNNNKKKENIIENISAADVASILQQQQQSASVHSHAPPVAATVPVAAPRGHSFLPEELQPQQQTQQQLVSRPQQQHQSVLEQQLQPHPVEFSAAVPNLADGETLTPKQHKQLKKFVTKESMKEKDEQDTKALQNARKVLKENEKRIKQNKKGARKPISIAMSTAPVPVSSPTQSNNIPTPISIPEILTAHAVPNNNNNNSNMEIEMTKGQLESSLTSVEFTAAKVNLYANSQLQDPIPAFNEEWMGNLVQDNNSNRDQFSAIAIATPGIVPHPSHRPSPAPSLSNSPRGAGNAIDGLVDVADLEAGDFQVEDDYIIDWLDPPGE